MEYANFIHGRQVLESPSAQLLFCNAPIQKLYLIQLHAHTFLVLGSLDRKGGARGGLNSFRLLLKFDWQIAKRIQSFRFSPPNCAHPLGIYNSAHVS